MTLPILRSRLIFLTSFCGEEALSMHWRGGVAATAADQDTDGVTLLPGVFRPALGCLDCLFLAGIRTELPALKCNLPTAMEDDFQHLVLHLCLPIDNARCRGRVASYC